MTPSAARVRSALLAVRRPGRPFGGRASAVGRHRDTMLDRSRKPLVVPFIVPAFLLCLVFIVVPVVQTVIASFTDWYVSSERNFVGTANYAELGRDAVFSKSVENTAFLIVAGAFVLIPVALVIAHASIASSRLAMLARLIVVAPIALTPIAAALVWKLALDPNLGIVNGALRSAGADDLALPWLGLRWSAPIAVMLATVWWVLGLYVVILGAAIAAIPHEIRDAARVDGASGMAMFRHLTLPLIWGTARVLLILWISTAVGALAFVQAMTGGGPLRTTETVATYLTKVAFSEARFGYAAAMATAATVALLGVTALLQRLTHKDEIEY